VPATYANGTLSVGPHHPEANAESACASTKTGDDQPHGQQRLHPADGDRHQDRLRFDRL